MGRRIDSARAVRRTAVLVAAATLAGCGAGQVRRGPAAVVARPAVVAARPAVVARPPVVAHRPGASLPAAAVPRPRAAWLIDPDAPLPRDSAWWPVLAVARRFAAADMSYEVDELAPAVRRAIARTCTAAFAAELLARPPSLPPGVNARQVHQRVAAITAVGKLRQEALVLVTVGSVHRGPTPGAFELRLVPHGRGWRVAGITVV